tara:strand:- start:275 stop:949 length:675 start_codon:yes stop_codon:yes gene_type:complete
MSYKNQIASNLLSLKKDVIKSCKEASRKNSSVKIVAVSKTVEEKCIIEAVKEGHIYFGENKVQEAKRKWPKIKMLYPKIKLHMLGALQSNKVKDAIKIFDVIETIDREKIAIEIAKYKKTSDIIPELFVQINIGEEPQKNGCPPHKSLDFIKECNLLGLNIKGVMGIAPINVSPSPYFALLKNIANEAALSNVSMGMSKDFKEAIYLGATSIRVGSRIFGERKT